MSYHVGAVEAFLRELESARIPCSENDGNGTMIVSSFVPKSKVQALLTKNVVKSALQLCCNGVSTIDPDVIIRHYPRCLCILLEMGYSQYGRYIQSIVRYRELRDEHWPLSSRPTQFPRDGDVWDQFYKHQWEFFPAMLDSDPCVFDGRRVVPFLNKKSLARGTSAKLYEVELDLEHDKLLQVGEGAIQPAVPRKFALKTYQGPHARQYFETEVENFTRLHRNEGRFLVGLLGLHTSFEHGKTFNVLFELANKGSLANLMSDTDPPRTGWQIYRHWKALLEILNALGRIHGHKDDGDRRKVFQGMHQDVCPKNILVFEETVLDNVDTGPHLAPNYCFKLADLGISHFELATEGFRDVISRDKPGTQAFGAPEAFRETEHEQRSNIQITRSIDIWSLGCVFLTFAVWIVYGPKGVREFRDARHRENDSNGTNAAYAFHNGRKPYPKVLQVVNQEISDLKRELRASDFTTRKVLDFLVVAMIDTDPDQRPSAAALHGYATRALQEAEQMLRDFYGSNQQRSSTYQLMYPSDPYDVSARQSSFYPSSSVGQLAETQASYEKASAGPEVSSDSKLPIDYTGARGISLRRSPKQRELPSTPPAEQTQLVTGLRNSEHFPGAMSTSSPVSFGQTSPPLQVFDEPKEGILRPGTNPVTPPSAESAKHGRSSDPMIPSNYDGTSTSAPPLASPFNPPPNRNAFLSVGDALKYIDSRIKMFNWRLQRLPDEHYRDAIKGRDHVFLIDDSGSLKDHGQHVVFVAKVLLYFASFADLDGVDIYFTSSVNKFHAKDYKDLVGHVKSRMTHAKGKTDIRARLGSILSTKRGELEKNQGVNVTPASVFVLTDGACSGLDNVENMIGETVKILKRFNKRSDQLCIQFISFGDNQDAIARLKSLDEFGKDSEVGLDIVDTTDHRGNVWKMLLGGFDKTFDEDAGTGSFSGPSRSQTMFSIMR